MEVRLNGTLRGLSGRRSVVLEPWEGGTVRDALAETVAQLPMLDGRITEGEELLPTVVVFLNGRNIRFYDGLNTNVQPDQILDIFPRTGAQRAFVKE